MKGLWISYLVGAILTLFFKWARYAHGAHDRGMSVGSATIDWFLDDSAENAVSWASTVGVVWLFGAIYVEKLPFLGGEAVGALPTHKAVAFLLGVIMESTAPAIFKAIAARIMPAAK